MTEDSIDGSLCPLASGVAVNDFLAGDSREDRNEVWVLIPLIPCLSDCSLMHFSIKDPSSTQDFADNTLE